MPSLPLQGARPVMAELHPKFLAVKNFSKFQHYKDRRPLWIKFYGSILDDYAFVQLPDASKAHLMLLWQVAATHGNRIPNDAKYIALATKARSKVNIAALLAAGFLVDADTIEEAGDSASNALAGGYQDASPEKNREEKSREDSSSALANARVKLISMLGDTDRAEREVGTFLAGLPNDTKRFAWASSFIAGLEGIGGPLIAAVPLLDGMADFNLSDRQQFPYNAAVFRAFVDRAGKPRLERTDRPRGTAAQRTMANAVEALKDIA
jgi:hypothetical protein